MRRAYRFRLLPNKGQASFGCKYPILIHFINVLINSIILISLELLIKNISKHGKI